MSYAPGFLTLQGLWISVRGLLVFEGADGRLGKVIYREETVLDSLSDLFQCHQNRFVKPPLIADFVDEFLI